MSLTLQVNPGQLPIGICPVDLQATLNAFSAAQTVTFPSTFSGVATSQTPPSDTSQVWIQLDSLGRPLGTFVFAQGSWLKLHPLIPGMCSFVVGVPPDFTTYDGGDSSALGPASGPMWEEVLKATFPVGEGTLASGTILTGGATGGEEKHTLLTTEMPSHTHGVERAITSTGAGANIWNLVPPKSETGQDDNQQPSSTQATGGDTTQTPPPTVAHNNMPPYTVVTFIRRSARLFYSVSA